MNNIELLPSGWKDPSPERPASFPQVLSFIQVGFRVLGPVAPSLASRLALRLFSTPHTRARHAVSDEWLESARLFEIPYDGLKLKGYEWGTGSRTVLLVHGWESRGTALRTFVPGLLEQGFRVVAFDGPAHGDSEGKHTNLRHFGGAILAVIRQLGGIYGIIAHSFGGASSLYALTQLSSGISVEKMVLIAMPASMVRIWKEAVHTLGLPARAANQFKLRMEQIGGQSLEEMDAAHSGPSLSHCRFLLVHDKQDTQVAVDNSISLVEKWPHAHLVLTDGYGHFRLMKNPDLLNRVNRFFSDH